MLVKLGLKSVAFGKKSVTLHLNAYEVRLLLLRN